MKDFDMLDLSKDPRYEYLKGCLFELSKKSCEVENLFKARHLDDHQIRIRENKRTDKELDKDKIISYLNEYINDVSNLEDKKYLAGRFIFMIMNLSIDEKNSKKKNLFKEDGLHVISAVLENHPISEKTRKSVEAYVKANNGKKHLTQAALQKLGPKRYKNPMEGLKEEDIVFSCKQIKDYVGYAYDCALDYNEARISAHSIFELLEKNTSRNGLDIVQPTIFEEAKKVKAINKEAVLEVAKAYASNIDIESNYYGQNNQDFDVSMEKMFCHIVTTYGYNPKEVEKLKQTLVDNSQDEKFAKRIAKNIGAAYVASMHNVNNLGR